jgi:site-specific DNA-methyltransferase (adenine-specific)
MNGKNGAISAERKYKTSVEEAYEYIENFDILETINNVGNDEIFTPVKLCNEILDVLPTEVWSNPNYKWLNPCDKNGVFLREIAIRLDEGLKNIIENQENRRKHILKNMLFSIGLTKFTSLVSRRTLYYCSQANRKFSINEEGFAIGNGTWFDDEEGNIKTPITKHSFDKKGKCIYCSTSSKGKYSNPNQIEHYAYEFIHLNNIEKTLFKRFNLGEDMKFDIIIGNPPYQLSTSGGQAQAKAIYYKFVEQAKRLNPKYLSMIIPSRWMSSGFGVEDFRKNMLDDKHITKLHHYENAGHCFPNNVEIKGGVCYFLRERDVSSKCEITIHFSDKQIQKSHRYLKEDDLDSDIFIRDERQIEILKKVSSKNESSISNICYSLWFYDLASDFFKNPSKFDLPPLSETPIDNGFTIYGALNGKRAIRYCASDYPFKKRLEEIKKWKVFIPSVYGSGKRNDIPSYIQIGEPNSLCTHSVMQIGNFDTRAEAENLVSYYKTKFFRFMLSVKRISINISGSILKFVPMQDFSRKWTDIELYERYELSDQEIEYIESHIIEMD